MAPMTISTIKKQPAASLALRANVKQYLAAIKPSSQASVVTEPFPLYSPTVPLHASRYTPGALADLLPPGPNTGSRTTLVFSVATLLVFLIAATVLFFLALSVRRSQSVASPVLKEDDEIQHNLKRHVQPGSEGLSRKKEDFISADPALAPELVQLQSFPSNPLPSVPGFTDSLLQRAKTKRRRRAVSLPVHLRGQLALTLKTTHDHRQSIAEVRDTPPQIISMGDQLRSTQFSVPCPESSSDSRYGQHADMRLWSRSGQSQENIRKREHHPTSGPVSSLTDAEPKTGPPDIIVTRSWLKIERDSSRASASTPPAPSHPHSMTVLPSNSSFDSAITVDLNDFPSPPPFLHAQSRYSVDV